MQLYRSRKIGLQKEPVIAFHISTLCTSTVAGDAATVAMLLLLLLLLLLFLCGAKTIKHHEVTLLGVLTVQHSPLLISTVSLLCAAVQIQRLMCSYSKTSSSTSADKCC
jgi:hypothetical protein